MVSYGGEQSLDRYLAAKTEPPYAYLLYSQLGDLLATSMILGVVIPLGAILLVKRTPFRSA
jgi:hypothetical protein